MSFTALPVQERLMDTMRDGRYRIIGFGGGIRGTKTWGMLAALVTLCRVFPKSRWAVVRQDLPTIKRNVLPSFNKLRAELGDFVGEVNQADSWSATCANGSQIIFFPESLKDDPDLERWKGLEVNGFLLEEASELAEQSFHKAIERAGAWIVPQGLTQPPPYVLCTFNPCGNWPKRVFYEPWKHGTIAAPYAFIPATAADNPYIPEAQRQAWRELPEQEYRRFVEGDWEVLTGRFYDELNGSVHVRSRGEVLPDPIPPWWEAWASYDWGYAHWATFGLWVRTPEGRRILVDSLWLRRHQDPAQAVAVARFAADHKLERALYEVYAGRDCWNKVTARGASGVSTADVFSEHGIHLLRADDDRVNSARAVRRALHVVDGEPGALMVDTPANRRVFQQLADLMPDDNDVNKPAKVDCDKEGRGGDDGADMFRNGLANKVPDSVEPTPELIEAAWEHGRDATELRTTPDLDPSHIGGLPIGF